MNALNAIGMEWGSVLDSAWNETWKLAKEYYEANGNLLVPDSFQIGGIDLGKWIAYQRSRKKHGRLSAERVAKLNEIGMVWDTVNSRWEQRYAQAKRYFDKKEIWISQVPTAVKTASCWGCGLQVREKPKRAQINPKG